MARMSLPGKAQEFVPIFLLNRTARPNPARSREQQAQSAG